LCKRKGLKKISNFPQAKKVNEKYEKHFQHFLMRPPARLQINPNKSQKNPFYWIHGTMTMRTVGAQRSTRPPMVSRAELAKFFSSHQ
jgi:hypothetical protein